MTKIKDLHAEWMKDAGYRREFEAHEGEFGGTGAVPKRHGAANPHIGESLESFLQDQGIADDVTRTALTRAAAIPKA